MAPTSLFCSVKQNRQVVANRIVKVLGALQRKYRVCQVRTGLSTLPSEAVRAEARLPSGRRLARPRALRDVGLFRNRRVVLRTGLSRSSARWGVCPSLERKSEHIPRVPSLSRIGERPFVRRGASGAHGPRPGGRAARESPPWSGPPDARYADAMTRDDLVRWLDDTLAIDAFEDPSLNGLQVEGTDEIAKVAVAVDASLSTFEQAAEVGADMLIVHHGLFWGGAEPVRGMMGRRLRYLLERDINLYAAHIPLDAHRELGNNWGLARILGMTELAPFGTWAGTPIGVKGAFPNRISLRDLADTIEKELGESVLVH